MSMRSVLPAVAALLLAAAPAVAPAATLDFAGEAGAAIASGISSTGTYSGNGDFGTVTVSANPRGSDLTQSAAGLGIDCTRRTDVYCLVDAANQIDYPEVLEISFTTPKFMTSVNISELFPSQTVGVGGIFSLVIEDMDAGRVVGSGFSINFTAANADANGNLVLAVNQWASSIRFVPVQGFFEDFSVAGITIDETRLPGTAPGTPSNPIPEPSSVLMLTLGGALVLLSIRKVAL
jgi:hypothetical protein